MKTKENGTSGKGILVLLIAALFVSAGGVPAVAGMHGLQDRQGNGMEARHHHRSALGIWRNPTLAQELELTDDQVLQLRNSEFSAREKQLKLKAQLDGYRLEMTKAFSGDSVDEKTVRPLAEKIADVKGALFVQRVESRLTVADILNADQIEKLKTLKGKQMKQDGHKKGKSGHRYGSKKMPCENALSAAIGE